jgi:hypothetical protein
MILVRLKLNKSHLKSERNISQEHTIKKMLKYLLHSIFLNQKKIKYFQLDFENKNSKNLNVYSYNFATTTTSRSRTCI